MAWTSWLVALVLMLLIGGAATFYLRRIRLPAEETAAGVAALAGMRWRDFIHLVLAALHKRGYERVFEPDATSEESEYLLQRDGKRWLLSSKHGAAYVLGSHAITEFANAIRMRGAHGGLLVTPGHFAPEAASLATVQHIELLDGPTLWPELRPLLPEAQRRLVTAPAAARTQQQVLLAWGIAVVTAAVVLVLPGGDGAAPADAAAMSTPAPRAAAAKTAAPAPAAVAKSTASPAPTDPAQLDQRRGEVAQAVSTLRGVDRALWSTQSTLLVYLLDEDADPVAQLCPLLERYEELRASRVQLQPPTGSDRPVRFLQCRTY